MIFGFDEHKGKVNVGDMLTQLQTNFQNNVNSLYNAFVSAGTTPTAKTPAALVTAVSTMINTIYNAFVNKGVVPASKTVSALVSAVASTYSLGYSDAQVIAWTETIDVYLKPSAITVDLNIDMSSVKEITIKNKNNGPWDYAAVNYSDAGRAESSAGTNSGWYGAGGTAGTTVTSASLMSKINSTYKYLAIVNLSSSAKGLTITITRQAKKLR